MNFNEIGLKDLVLDFDSNDLQDITIVQGDTKTRGFKVLVSTNNGEIIKASSNYEMRLYGVNSNYPDKSFFTKGTIDGDFYKVYISTDMASKSGKLQLQLALFEGTNALIQSRIKEVDVYNSIANGGNVGKDLVVDFTRLQEALDRVDVQEKKYDKSLVRQEAIESDVNKKHTEVVQIRDGLKGVLTTENARVEAEKKRVSAEQTRVSQEKTRQSNEQTRISNETARKQQEDTRNSQEKTRQTQEQSRVDVEKKRVSTETSREQSEKARSTKETERQNAEKIRQSSEQTRVSQEDSRVEAEKQRAKSESDRAGKFDSWDKTMQGVIPNATSTIAGVVKIDKNGESVAVSKKTHDEDVNIFNHGLGEKANKTHKHSIADVEGLINKLAEKASNNDLANVQANVDKKANKTHTHNISDVSNLQTTLDNKANKTHKHSIADVEGVINELDKKATVESLVDFGGRNLIKNSDNITEWIKQDGGSHLITDEYMEEFNIQGQHIRSDAANATDFIKTYVNLDVDDLVVGKTYTFSVYVKNNRDVTAGLRVNGFNWDFSYSLNANECKRFVVTGKRDSMDGYWKNRIQFQLRSANKAQFVDMTVARPQLELGSIATDWTPNPEDFNTKIDTLSTEINKKADNLEISNLQKDILVSYMTSGDTDIQNIALKSKDIGKAVYRYLEVTNQTNNVNKSTMENCKSLADVLKNIDTLTKLPSMILANEKTISTVVNDSAAMNKVFNNNATMRVIANNHSTLDIIANNDNAMGILARSKFARPLTSSGNTTGRFIILGVKYYFKIFDNTQPNTGYNNYNNGDDLKKNGNIQGTNYLNYLKSDKTIYAAIDPYSSGDDILVLDLEMLN